ncbi:hypothetical protein AUJ42_00025 [Candidatus Collierbacteria bacterium CG1_02_44_10]|uniref:Uncharacterized protein n=1 Tax=Candidatus Collierbacteria bacterium CG1_02_44_10 TaxID=1805087 RepID=A0A1J4S2D5_9BACT|nr:MAG: hypothetical protein AUJ42_00025 [Candidatus Collierbacteria bacterium CG1_02_44_10]
MKKLMRIALAVVIALTLLGSLPIPVRAESDPVDLVLGGEGATSWQIANIAPGQSGAKTVTLHNAGYADGWVTIWITDIQETDYAGDGAWLDDYVVFNASGDRLRTNLSLPVKIRELPQNATGKPNYLMIELLKAGETITLIWHWNFLAEAGNKVQGDSFSFTINYRLEELPPPPVYYESPPIYYVETNLFGLVENYRISYSGEILKTIEVSSKDGILTISIPKGTIALDKDGRRLENLKVAVDESPPLPPKDAHIIGLAYNFGPSGATFDPGLTLTWRYDPEVLPERVKEENLVLAYYDQEAGKWMEIEYLVDTEKNTITASINHFTTFAIIGYEVVSPPVIPPPPPVPPVLPEPIPIPPSPPPPKPTPPTPSVTPVPPVSPVPTPAEETNWPLIGGIIAGVLVISSISYFVIRRRRAKKG